MHSIQEKPPLRTGSSKTSIWAFAHRKSNSCFLLWSDNYYFSLVYLLEYQRFTQYVCAVLIWNIFKLQMTEINLKTINILYFECLIPGTKCCKTTVVKTKRSLDVPCCYDMITTYSRSPRLSAIVICGVGTCYTVFNRTTFLLDHKQSWWSNKIIRINLNL